MKAITPKAKLKHIATINDETLGENTDPDYEIQYVDISNVDSSGKINGITSYRFEEAPSRARRRTRDGDVIISTVRTYLQAIAHIQNPPENLIASTGFAVVRAQPKRFATEYCKYALREPSFLAEVEIRSVGANYPAINPFDLASIRVPVHPLSRQRAIADYLDRETKRIDALAVAKKRLLDLLTEKRHALITRVVTRGLESNAPIRSTGVREGGGYTTTIGGGGVKSGTSRYCVRLKYRAHIEMGQSPPSTEYSSSPEDGLPFLQGTTNFGTASPTPISYCGSPTKLAHAGDILFSVRAPVGEINFADQKFGIGRGLCVIRPQRHWDARFAWWALHEARYQLNFVSAGSTYDAVATEDVRDLLVETPPLDAQRAIADYLDRETARLDSLSECVRECLSFLKERRSALIAAAVTGQLKVP